MVVSSSCTMERPSKGDRRKSIHVVAKPESVAVEAPLMNPSKASLMARRKTIGGIEVHGQQQQQQQQRRQSEESSSGRLATIKEKKHKSPGRLLSSKTPTKKRVDLGAASGYYFKNVPPTPVEMAISSVKKMSNKRDSNTSQDATMDIASILGTSYSNYNNHTKNDGTTTSYNLEDSSYLSSDSSNNTSTASGFGNGMDDMLNQTTSSDTTELTASNFVRMQATSSHRQQQQLAFASLLEARNAFDNHNNISQISSDNVVMAAPSPRQENRPIESGGGDVVTVADGVALQKKRPLPDTDDDITGDNVSPKKPLGTAHANSHKHHRNSLPPPSSRPLTMMMAASHHESSSSQPLLNSNGSRKRRESWHGTVAPTATAPTMTTKPTSTATATATAPTMTMTTEGAAAAALARLSSTTVLPESMRKMASSLKEARLQHEKNREEGYKRRLSSASNNTTTDDTTGLFSISETEAALETNKFTPSSLEPPAIERHTALTATNGLFKEKSPEKNNTTTVHDQQPLHTQEDHTTTSFSGTMKLPSLSPILKRSTSGKKRSSVSGKTGASPAPPSSSTNNVLDTSKRSLDNLFDGVLATSTTSSSDGDTTASSNQLMLLMNTSASTSSVAKSNIKDVGSTSRLFGSSHRTSVSSASTITTTATTAGVAKAPSTSAATSKNPAYSSSSCNSSKSSRPLPDVIAFEPSSILALNAQATSPFRYDTEKGERKALTPTKLSKSPQRVLDPMTVESPARHTRSAKKRQAEAQPEADKETAVSTNNDVHKERETENVVDTELKDGSSNAFNSPNRPSTALFDASPAFHTRSAEKRRMMEEELKQQESMEVEKDEEELKAGYSPQRHRRRSADLNSVDSPARHTRSAEKNIRGVVSHATTTSAAQGEIGDEPKDVTGEDATMNNNDLDSRTGDIANGDQSDGQFPNRKRKEDVDVTVGTHSSETMESATVRGQEELDGSVIVHAQKRRKSNTTVLNSALRSGKKDLNVRKTVAFGSPEIEYFNEKSPSISVTPARRRRETEDVIVEIEPNVDAFFQEAALSHSAASVSDEQFRQNAGSTPLVLKKAGHPRARRDSFIPLQQLPSVDDSNMSIDDESLTMTMEVGMDTLQRNDGAVAVRDKGASMTAQVRANLDLLDEEDETVEFEMDLGHFLDDGAEGSVLTSDHKSRRRRSSLSSSRFSLAPDNRRVSLMSAGERGFHAATALGQTQLSEESSVHSSTEERKEVVVYDLKNREIVEACGLTNGAFDDEMDILYKFYSTEPSTSTMKECLVSAYDRLHPAIDKDLDLDEVFEGTEAQREDFIVLQEALRSGGDPALQREVHKLMGAVRRNEEKQLLSWLVSVAEALKEKLGSEAAEMNDKLNEVEIRFKRVDDNYNKLARLETKAARKARRKSLLRRQSNASILEEEISDLEAKLESARSDLESAKKERNIVNELVTSASQLSTMTETVSAAKSRAESSERDYAIVSGLGKLRPATMTESNLRFHFAGPCPAACIAVAFSICKSGQVTCQATTQPDLFSQFKGRPLKSTSTFFEARVSAICSDVSKKQLDNPSQIGAFLRRLEWVLRRLEHTGSEVAMLQRRYKACVLLSSSESSSINLQVPFSSQNGQAKLVATFEITPAYPFSPVAVALNAHTEGIVDMEAIQKVLIKNAKPGFGYLSRTCDMIAAFLR